MTREEQRKLAWRTLEFACRIAAEDEKAAIQLLGAAANMASDDVRWVENAYRSDRSVFREFYQGIMLLLGALLLGCGGAVPAFDQAPECQFPPACVGLPRCELADGTVWLENSAGRLHQQTIVGNESSVTSTLCAIDWEGRRIDR